MPFFSVGKRKQNNNPKTPNKSPNSIPKKILSLFPRVNNIFLLYSHFNGKSSIFPVFMGKFKIWKKNSIKKKTSAKD